MYKVPYFTETDEAKVLEMMERNPFAIITGILNGFPVAAHIPLEIEKRDGTLILKGHIMKETDHYKAFMQNDNVLVIFTGPNCYVSASWYVTKNIASTWNYMDVYIKGKVKFTDAEGTKKILESTTNKYEKPGSDAGYNKMSIEYVNRMAEAIVGLHIEVESMENVFKLSQNRDEISKQQIIENLRKSDDFFTREIAREMALRKI